MKLPVLSWVWTCIVSSPFQGNSLSNAGNPRTLAEQSRVGYVSRMENAMTPDPVRTAISRGPCPSFPRLAARYFEEYLEKIRRAVELLDDD